MCCRVVVQQCLKARLAVAEDDCVEIGRGIVLFVSFLENATRDDVLRTAKSVLNVKLCDSGEGALVSVLELPGDVLVVPQACLAGKRKGNRVQYHGLVSKDRGQEFYSIFVEQCQILMSERQWCGGRGISAVRSGTYGDRQVLSMETNGPFTHVLDY
uniref:D-aminoacyl-tRNA deacylase n=1 Tax=Ixodes ricinus TaxID=34613 RepID=A0A6B0UW10_IXORI